MGTKLYVGNLNYNTTEESLRTAFSANGREVTSVSIIMDRETGRSRGFAFVELSTSEGAQQAMAELEGQDLDGRMLRINEARERDSRGPRPAGGYSSGPPSSGPGGGGGYSSGPGPSGGGGGGYPGRPPGVGPGPNPNGPPGGPGGFRSGPPNSGGYRPPGGGGPPGGFRSGPASSGDGRRKRSDKEKERGREGVAADRKKPRRANDDGDGW